MLRTYRALVAIVTVTAVGAAAWLGMSGSRAVDAQSDFPLGIAATLRVSRQEVRRGAEVALVGGVQNMGSRVIEVEFSCAPPVDFEVRDEAGTVVWQHTSACGGDDLAIRLEPGARREWDAVWPGTGPDGMPVPVGAYSLWAIIHTAGRDTGAGPLWVHVFEGDGPTEEPRPTEGPRPTEEPHPTDSPRPTEVVPADGPPFLVGGGDGAQRRPDVAGNPELEDCQNLVVWWNEAQGSIMGRFVETGWRGEPFNISGDIGGSGAPAVAYHPSRRTWLVLWDAATPDGVHQLFARYVQCAGLEGPVRQLTDGENSKDQVAVARHGEGFAVAWRERQGDAPTQIRGAALMGEGLSQQVELQDGGSSEPAVACEPLEPCLVVWTQSADVGTNVIGRWWWPREEARGSMYLTVAGGEPAQREPAVAWRGGEEGHYLVTWTEGPERTSVVRARGVGVEGSSRTADSYRLVTEPTTLSEGATAAMSDVAALGDWFVVVWSESSPGPMEIGGRKVRIAEGANRHGPYVEVSRPVIDFPPGDTWPAVAAAGRDVALVVWESRTTSPEDPGEIYGRHRTFASGGDMPRVELEGRVTRVGVGLMQDGRHIEVAVERVLAGVFSCQTAHVYFDAGTWPVPEVGNRVRVSAEPASSGESCALDVGAPGTGLAALTAEPAFAPYALQP